MNQSILDNNSKQLALKKVKNYKLADKLSRKVNESTDRANQVVPKAQKLISSSLD